MKYTSLQAFEYVQLMDIFLQSAIFPTPSLRLVMIDIEIEISRNVLLTTSANLLINTLTTIDNQNVYVCKSLILLLRSAYLIAVNNFRAIFIFIKKMFCADNKHGTNWVIV